MLPTYRRQTRYIDYQREWFYFLLVWIRSRILLFYLLGRPGIYMANSSFASLPAKQNWRLEAASPDTLPKSAADRVRRLLVATNSSMEYIRGLHKSLVRQIHPDKCGGDAWLHSMRCNHLQFFKNKEPKLFSLERNSKAPTPLGLLEVLCI